jgi:uncharacterized protein YggE
MSKFKLFASAGLIALVYPMDDTRAQSNSAENTPFIETLGTGQALLDFDRFSLVVQARGQAASRAEALRKSSEQLNRLRASVPTTRDLSNARIDALDPVIEPVGPGCEAYRSNTCTPTGHLAIIRVSITASPPSAAPALLLALEEQGFQTFAPSYELQDKRAAKSQSERRAFENARATADALASVAGCRRGKLISLSLRGADNFYRNSIDAAAAAASEAVDAVVLSEGESASNLQLDPGKAVVTTEVRTKFALECR